MRFQTAQCLSCDSYRRKNVIPWRRIESNGRVGGTDYWFCSEQCFIREYVKYMDNRVSPPLASRFRRGCSPADEVIGMKVIRCGVDSLAERTTSRSSTWR